MTIEAGSDAAVRGRRIRLGMVGGGQGAFIGAVHRLAARMDDHYELVAGALALAIPPPVWEKYSTVLLAVVLDGPGHGDSSVSSFEYKWSDDGKTFLTFTVPPAAME